jgi:hypothetical protein
MIAVYILAALCIVAQGIDWHTTRWINKRGGVELNPIMAKGMQLIGLDAWLLLTKGVIGCGIPIAAVWLTYTGQLPHAWYALPFFLVVSVVPLSGNVEAMRRMKARGL